MSEDTKRSTEQSAAGPQPSADVLEAMRIADEAERQRKSAPVVLGGGRVRIKAKETIDRFAKAQGGQDAKGGRHFFFVPRRDMKEHAFRGAKPVVDNGQLVANESDVLVSTSSEAYLRTLAENQRQDIATRANLAQAQEEAAKASGSIAKDQTVQVSAPGTPGHEDALRKAGVK
jgi:hypothetical protein